PRWEILADTGADMLACETTPSIEETHAYCRLAAVSGRPTWVSFQCRDETAIADGTPLESAAAVCDEEPNVVAVGINCTDPGLVDSLLEEARRGTTKPLLVYPNGGEEWDAQARAWVGAATPTDWAARAVDWYDRGAAGIGGCCRVGPSDIRVIGEALRSRSSAVSSAGSVGSRV
ncbi:MAG: homocysteine S-methyltransferase family protein, partial [Gemmatimonadota bacterium]